MTSQQLLDWLEEKLAVAGVQKMVPDQDALAKAYKRAVRQAAVQHKIDEALTTLPQDNAIDVPPDLAERIREAIADTEQSWDQAVWQLVNNREMEICGPITCSEKNSSSNV